MEKALGVMPKAFCFAHILYAAGIKNNPSVAFSDSFLCTRKPYGRPIVAPTMGCTV